jgi:hypothetical protein
MFISSSRHNRARERIIRGKARGIRGSN